MKEKIEKLIKELGEENIKLNTQLNDNPDMLWTYKSAKMNTISVNTTTIIKMKEIIMLNKNIKKEVGILTKDKDFTEFVKLVYTNRCRQNSEVVEKYLE